MFSGGGIFPLQAVRVIPRFPSVRLLFLSLGPKNLRKITGATNKDHLCVSKNLLGSLNSHSNPWVWDTCLSLYLTKDRSLLIKKKKNKKIQKYERDLFYENFCFIGHLFFTFHGCIYLTEVNYTENAKGNARLPSQLLHVLSY